MKRKNFYLPEPQICALEKIAKLKGVSVAEVIRRAIEEYLERH